MRDRKSFLVGMLTAVLGLSFVLFGWISLHLHRSVPVTKLNPKSKGYHKPSGQEIKTATASLTRLYYFNKFLGFETYAANSMIGLAKVSSLAESQKTNAQTTYLFLKSMEEAESLTLDKKGLINPKATMEPLVEAYVNYSEFLEENGQRKRAVKTLRRAKKMVEQNKNANSSLETINSALHKINAG